VSPSGRKRTRNRKPEQTKLLNTIYELEQRNQSLLAKVKREVLGSESQNALSAKRKAASTSNNSGKLRDTKKRSRRPAKKEVEDMEDDVERESYCLSV
jgi:hypothetical protein